MKTSYKGRANIVDNIRNYRGYFEENTSSGSLWIGSTLRPLSKFEDNFQVVSTDYHNYAILYSCTYRTAMYDKDLITILVRNPPGQEKVSDEIEQKVRDEFVRIFGPT